jgi:predicted GIY-YIG superfamily endonuclease
MSAEGTVYLLHFERPYYGLMQHYVGFAYDLDQRLRAHREGTACSTTRHAFEQGIGFELARTWPGTAKLERQIKSRGPSNYCPLCPRRRLGRESAPSNLIGAKGFAVQDHSPG